MADTTNNERWCNAAPDNAHKVGPGEELTPLRGGWACPRCLPGYSRQVHFECPRCHKELWCSPDAPVGPSCQECRKATGSSVKLTRTLLEETLGTTD